MHIFGFSFPFYLVFNSAIQSTSSTVRPLTLAGPFFSSRGKGFPAACCYFSQRLTVVLFILHNFHDHTNGDRNI